MSNVSPICDTKQQRGRDWLRNVKACAVAPCSRKTGTRSRPAIGRRATRIAHGSLPLSGALLEVCGGCAHHAESLAGGRFHHPPALNLLNALRAELLEPPHLGIDVVSFDVQ